MPSAWIKMRMDIADDPAVISIAAMVKIDEYGVVGRLHKIWSWMDSQSCDGNAPGVTEKWLDRYIGVTGFTAAMVSVGWIIVDESGIHIPNFHRHNGQTAKARALTSKRVDNHRSAKCNAPTVTEALPEKRREEKSNTGGTEAPPKDSFSQSDINSILARYPVQQGIKGAEYQVGRLLVDLRAHGNPDPVAFLTEAVIAYAASDMVQCKKGWSARRFFEDGHFNDDRNTWRDQKPPPEADPFWRGNIRMDPLTPEELKLYSKEETDKCRLMPSKKILNQAEPNSKKP